MLKTGVEMNGLEFQAVEAIEALLRSVPFIHAAKIEPTSPDPGFDILVEFHLDGNRHFLACEVKSGGQPRHVRAALLQLRKAAERFDPPATPIFMAPYLSQEAQTLCREFDVGYLDLVGNTRIAFDTVFIERQVNTKPPAVQRNLKSIFKPKSARILRTLLRDPGRSWRVVDLSQASDVSLGHVSNVRNELINREWAEITDDGLRLSQPAALLNAWRDTYEPPAGERIGFYTTLHGKSLEIAARSVLSARPSMPCAVFASFSAAHWLAPYGRVPTTYFYADMAGVTAIREGLNLTPASSGANVVVMVPKDRGLFDDTSEPAAGVVCTSPVQTYLDLAVAGERGAEAAEYLRQELLAW